MHIEIISTCHESNITITKPEVRMTIWVGSGYLELNRAAVSAEIVHVTRCSRFGDFFTIGLNTLDEADKMLELVLSGVQALWIVMHG